MNPEETDFDALCEEALKDPVVAAAYWENRAKRREREISELQLQLLRLMPDGADKEALANSVAARPEIRGAQWDAAIDAVVRLIDRDIEDINKRLRGEIETTLPKDRMEGAVADLGDMADRIELLRGKPEKIGTRIPISNWEEAEILSEERWYVVRAYPKIGSTYVCRVPASGRTTCGSVVEYGMKEPVTLDIVFDGPPGPESGRFVEVEIEGKGVRLGEWVEREDGLWALRLPFKKAQ